MKEVSFSVKTVMVVYIMKIATVLSVFKISYAVDITNHCPISVLPCFSKILVS